MSGNGAIGAVVAASAAPTAQTKKADLHRAAQAFEALMIQSLLKAMRQAQLQDGLFGSEAGADVYEGMFDTHLSELVAGSSRVGIAAMLERQWAEAPALPGARTAQVPGKTADSVDESPEARRAGGQRTPGTRSAP